MDKRETIALWQRCEDARAAALVNDKDAEEAHAVATATWNDWAHKLLASKDELEKSGTWKWDAMADFSALRFVPQNDGAKAPIQEEEAPQIPGAELHDAESLTLASNYARFDSWIFPGNTNFDGAQFFAARFCKARFLGDASFRKTQFSGDANFNKAQFCADTWFEETRFSGAASSFDAAQFLGDVEFQKVEFMGVIGFCKTQFSGDAAFEEAQFSGSAWFESAKFSGDAVFDKAAFAGDLSFDKVQFSSDAWFNEARFEGTAWFTIARCEGGTSFEKAYFAKDAIFDAMRGESFFDLENVIFDALPSFVQASFKEALRLDHITPGKAWEPGNFYRSLGWRIPVFGLRSLSGIKCDKEVTSKYRALKRLAIQGHDHEREYLFFKGELRSRRTSEDRWWYSRYWLGLFYDVISDFGRSVWRPVAVWLLWATALAVLYVNSAVSAGGIQCMDLFWKGLYLGLRNGFPFGNGRDQRIVDVYSCLYAGAAQGTFPNVPVWISVAELVHLLGSVILIFLIVLAVRNQFKIK